MVFRCFLGGCCRRSRSIPETSDSTAVDITIVDVEVGVAPGAQKLGAPTGEESALTIENLGKIELTIENLEKLYKNCAAPRGVPQIEVTFDIDASGILSVAAKDRGTGKEQTVTITGSTTLDANDVERMVGEAEEHAEEDERRKDAVETRNNAESLVYQCEKQVQELGDKVPAEVLDAVQPKLQALKDAVAQPDADSETLRSLSKDLQEELMKVGQAAYASAGGSGDVADPAADNAGADAPPSGADDVIDVD